MKHFLILLSTLFIISCSTPNKNTEPPEPLQEYDEILYNYWPTESESQILYEVVTLETEGFTGEYPSITNLEPEHPLNVAVNVYSQDVQKAQQEQQTFWAEEKADPDTEYDRLPWDYSVAWLGGRHHPELWSLAFQVYSYTGGAHPNHWTNTFNYHPGSNTILKLENLFNDPAVWEILDTAVLAGVISEKQKRWSEWDGEAYDSTQDFFMEDLTFDAKTLDSWVVTKKEGLMGLLFFFDPYDVGPYAEGGYEVFVPIAVVQEWVKDEFKGIFE